MSILSEQAQRFREIYSQRSGVFNVVQAVMQLGLIAEESAEFSDAISLATADLSNKRAREEALKELADLVFVCYQFAAMAGWDLDEALQRVFASNLSKLVDGKPLKREDGKVLKGPNYRKPSLIDLV
jgi:NTP pyrophosphatase (non-canonical NTP hydrolase)